MIEAEEECSICLPDLDEPINNGMFDKYHETNTARLKRKQHAHKATKKNSYHNPHPQKKNILL